MRLSCVSSLVAVPPERGFPTVSMPATDGDPARPTIGFSSLSAIVRSVAFTSSHIFDFIRRAPISPTLLNGHLPTDSIRFLA